MIGKGNPVLESQFKWLWSAETFPHNHLWDLPRRVQTWGHIQVLWAKIPCMAEVRGWRRASLHISYVTPRSRWATWCHGVGDMFLSHFGPLSTNSFSISCSRITPSFSMLTCYHVKWMSSAEMSMLAWSKHTPEAGSWLLLVCFCR